MLTRQLVAALSIISVVFAASVPSAAFGRDEGAYGQCIAQSLRGTVSQLAAQKITAACDQLSGRSAALMRDNDVRYNTCVVQNLQGIANDFAAQQITSVCARQNGR